MVLMFDQLKSQLLGDCCFDEISVGASVLFGTLFVPFEKRNSPGQTRYVVFPTWGFLVLLLLQ